VGAGPRGAIALVRAARALAVLAGRDFVLPDDVKRMAQPALLHRVILSPEMEIEGYQPARAIAEVVDRVEAPRV
jgi:MoxR-like ATPase